MIETITPWVTQGGAVALLLAAMWLILTGKIVARSSLQQQREDLLPWKEAAEKALATNAEMAAHMGQLVSTVDKAVEVMLETQRLVRDALPRKDPA